jgi:predicted DNA-binding transcriptional regulator AlpA
MKRQKRLAASTAIEQARANTSNDRDDSDDAVTINGVAAMFEVSLVSVWRMVKEGRLPRPFYPRSRCPRWSKRELRDTRELLRMSPNEAKAAHRAEKLRVQQQKQAYAPWSAGTSE